MFGIIAFVFEIVLRLLCALSLLLSTRPTREDHAQQGEEALMRLAQRERRNRNANKANIILIRRRSLSFSLFLSLASVLALEKNRRPFVRTAFQSGVIRVKHTHTHTLKKERRMKRKIERETKRHISLGFRV
jgi:hypothetical protein